MKEQELWAHIANDSTVEYEIFLRRGIEKGEFYVDVREDIVNSDGDIINGGEYLEGEIFDDYNKAKETFLEFGRIYQGQRKGDL